MTTDIILTWMEAALKRDMHELRKELCVLRDILDGILDEWPEYVQKHLPAIGRELAIMLDNENRANEHKDENEKKHVVADICSALGEKIKEMSWTYSD